MAFRWYGPFPEVEIKIDSPFIVAVTISDCNKMKHLLTLVGFLVVIGFGITVFFVLGRWRGSEAINIPNAPGQQIEGTAQDIKTQQRTPRKQNPIQQSDDKVSNDPEDFYRVIIENNIFRPLNWKPTQPEPAYTLLGTAITPDGSSATAYITERKTKQFYAVKTGEKIGDAVVKEIQPKQVTLDKEGKMLSLSMVSVPFLSRTGSRSSPSYQAPRPQVVSKSSNSERAQPRTTKDQERQAWRDMQKERIAELKKMAEKLRATSEEERRRMREHLERQKR